jgi:Tol biopolymer transport system component
MRSELCIHDLSTGGTSVLLTHDGIIEAPNWHPDGFLLVNGEGRLFRVPLEAPAWRRSLRGRCGGSTTTTGSRPDGRRLAISAHDENRKSCIYLMPVEGGEPARVTPLVPSWWHGWSPDGERLAYVAAREGAPILPYTCRLDGSDERLLVDGFDHVDGTDYTPDGTWIWFNGEREGRVDLWRVRPDGSGLERMTDGETVDWFPHPSPDGSLVLFLAYPPGTRGHPAMLDVALCVMPAEGGEAREVVRLRGGQGTINVPCWAPDGRRFAFMRFAE